MAKRKIRKYKKTYNYNGFNYTIKELAKMAGVSLPSMYARLKTKRNILDVVRPKNRFRNMLTYPVGGVAYTLDQLATKFKIDKRTITSRLRNGWTIEEAVTIPVNSLKNHHKNK